MRRLNLTLVVSSIAAMAGFALLGAWTLPGKVSSGAPAGGSPSVSNGTAPPSSGSELENPSQVPSSGTTAPPSSVPAPHAVTGAS